MIFGSSFIGFTAGRGPRNLLGMTNFINCPPQTTSLTASRRGKERKGTKAVIAKDKLSSERQAAEDSPSIPTEFQGESDRDRSCRRRIMERWLLLSEQDDDNKSLGLK